MCRRTTVFLLSLGVVLATIPQATRAADSRPNFLLIIADDLTWRDLGYEGNREIHTPHLDRLRTESMHLTRMFTPATTCSPSRHALYTGLYCVRAGAYPRHAEIKARLKRELRDWMRQQGDEGLAPELKAHARQAAGRAEKRKSKGG